MPFRHAHDWLLALFPLIVIAFWPGYFGHLTTARGAQHAHGVAATAWLALLTVQSWSVHARRVVWHRGAGLAVFAVVPLFAAAGLYAVHDMAMEMSAGSPFEAAFAPGLATDDLSSIVALVGFVAAALATRRRVGRHAAWMLATALLVLPPMTTRLIQVLARVAALQPPSFWTSFVIGQSVSIAAALLLANRRRTDAQPFVVLTAIFLAQLATYRLFGPSPAWRAALAAFGAGPSPPSAAAAGALALATLVLAWRRVPARAKPGGARRATLEPVGS